MESQAKPVDVEKLFETGKALLEGEQGMPPIKKISEHVEQVRYAEEQRLSSTGQAVLKDLEEILATGTEAATALPPETFLHAARAQKAAKELKDTGEEEEEEEEEEENMDLMAIARSLVTSSEYREVFGHWFQWISTSLQEQVKEAANTESPDAVISLSKTTDELVSLLDWVQDKPEYQSALGYLCDQVQLLSDSFLEGAPENEVQEPEAKEKLQNTVEQFKLTSLDALKAIESWTNEDFSNLPNTLSTIYEAVRTDQKLINGITAFGHFLRNCFMEEGFLNDRTWIKDEARDLINNLNAVIDEGGHRERFNSFIQQLGVLFESLKHEPKTTKLKESLRKLLEDLFVSEETEAEEGQLLPWRLKTELIGDLGVLLGDLAKKVRFLRVPDINIHDEDLSFTAQNIILDAKELLPQQFKLTLVTENMAERAQEEELADVEDAGRIRVDPEASAWTSHMKFECKGIRGHCRNIHFHMKKTSGFPQVSDEGSADLRVWGRHGMLIKVVLRPDWIIEQKQTIVSEQTVEKREPVGLAILSEPTLATVIPTEPTHTAPSTTTTGPTTRKLRLSVVKARCDIDELDLDLHGTRRDWFYSMFGPIVRHRVKAAMERAVEKNILSLMD